VNTLIEPAEPEKPGAATGMVEMVDLAGRQKEIDTLSDAEAEARLLQKLAELGE
jgi:hypothetical protein